MNQGFALYNYIRKEVKNTLLSKLCFHIINDVMSSYNRLVAKRLKKDPKRNDMNLNPNPTDVKLFFDEKGDLQLVFPGYYELYYGFIKKNVNSSITKWIIRCGIQGAVIR